MRKYILGLCVLVMTGIVAHAAYAQTETTPPFSDVDKNSRYYAAVQYLYDQGVIEGYEDGTFRPNQKVNRAEALKIILLGSDIEPNANAALPFPDTGSGAWYAPYIQSGLDLNIVQGYPDGTFKPEQNVIKVESLKMLLITNNIPLRAVQLSDTALYDDTPIETGTLWYQPYLFYARQKNIAEPENVYTFGPQIQLTRGALAEQMYRLAYIRANQLDRFDTSQKGVASYYGDSFEGRNTSSGESFSNFDFSAAHRYWPFHTFVQVINNNTGVATVVKVTDRGPYVDGRVIDLSKAAFGAIERISRGLANVTIIPLGVIPGISKGWIDVETFLDTNTRADGVTLDKAIPNLYFTNETYTITGSTATPATTVTALLTSKKTGNKSYLQSPVVSNRFALPLSFSETGAFSLNLIPDSLGIGYAEVYTIEDTLLAGIETIANTASPLNLSTIFVQNKATLAWEQNGNTLFRVHLAQGDQAQSWYVNNHRQWEVPFEQMQTFSPGPIVATVAGARTSSDFSSDRYTDWAVSSTKSITAITHEYEIYRKEKITLQPFSQTISGDEIRLSGTASVPLEGQAWYTLPSGNVETLKIVPAGQIPAKQSFSFDVPLTEAGTYIVEINDTNGEAVFNYPFYVAGEWPVLPNPRDIKASFTPTETIRLSSEREKILADVNATRKALNLPKLTLQETLNSLAQARSDDMAARNYFGHVTPEGTTVEDLLDDFGLEGSIGENIAKDINSKLGLYGLFRSPAHRSLLLTTDLTKIGIGLSKAKDGQIVLTQVFQ